MTIFATLSFVQFDWQPMLCDKAEDLELVTGHHICLGIVWTFWDYNSLLCDMEWCHKNHCVWQSYSTVITILEKCLRIWLFSLGPTVSWAHILSCHLICCLCLTCRLKFKTHQTIVYIDKDHPIGLFENSKATN